MYLRMSVPLGTTWTHEYNWVYFHASFREILDWGQASLLLAG